MNLIFLGASGSGKDTQAELLVKQFGYTRVSTGDLLRMLADGESEMQNMVKLAMNNGFLNDYFVYGLLEIYFKYSKLSNVILSGVVRSVNQADLLDIALKKNGMNIDKAIYFELSDAEAVKRLSGRRYCPNCKANYHREFKPEKIKDQCDFCSTPLVTREDDNPESIKKRLTDFHKENDLIIEKYKARGILEVIDATPSIEEIYKNLLLKLGL